MSTNLKKDIRDTAIGLVILYILAYIRMSRDFTWGGYAFVCSFITASVVAGVVILRVYQHYK